jgi:hypothetical protein
MAASQRGPAVLRRPLPIAAADVRGARLLLLLVAALVTAVDLGDEIVSPTLPDYYHTRPLSIVATMVAVTALGCVAFPRTGSRGIAVAGGLMVGGGIANTISFLAWGRGIPNPIVSYRLGAAFNLADLAVAAGFVLLVPAAIVFALRHRHELDARLF